MEEQINDLSISLRNMEQQFLNAKQEQQKDIKHQKEIFEKKIRTLENKSEKLAAENFEHVVANVSCYHICSLYNFNLLFRKI